MPAASPEVIDTAFFDERDEVPPYEPQPWHESPKNAAKLGETMAWAMSTDSLPNLDADKELARSLREQRPDLTVLTDAALHACGRDRWRRYIQQTFQNAMIVSSLSALGTGALGAICEGLGDRHFVIRLLAGIEVDSAVPSHAMWELGRRARVARGQRGVRRWARRGLVKLAASSNGACREFLGAFEQFLRDHGSRGQNEYDPRSPSWEIKPRIALAAIDLMRKSDDSQAPVLRNAASMAERDRVTAMIREQVAADPETSGLFEAALQSAQLFLAGRERAKTNVVRVINEARVALSSSAAGWSTAASSPMTSSVFMVTDEELDPLRAEPEAFGTSSPSAGRCTARSSTTSRCSSSTAVYRRSTR